MALQPIPIRPRQAVYIRLERFDNRIVEVCRLTAAGLEELDAWRNDSANVEKLYALMQTTLPALTLDEIKALAFDEMTQILEVAYADIAYVELLAGKGEGDGAEVLPSPTPAPMSSVG